MALDSKTTKVVSVLIGIILIFIGLGGVGLIDVQTVSTITIASISLVGSLFLLLESFFEGNERKGVFITQIILALAGIVINGSALLNLLKIASVASPAIFTINSLPYGLLHLAIGALVLRELFR